MQEKGTQADANVERIFFHAVLGLLAPLIALFKSCAAWPAYCGRGYACVRRQAKETKHMSTAMFASLHATPGLVGIGLRTGRYLPIELYNLLQNRYGERKEAAT